MKFRLVLSFLALSLTIQSAVFAVTIRDVTYKTRNAGTVIFSHSDHIDKKEMRKNCRACHDAIFDLKNKKQYSMVEMEKGKSCGACHNGKRAFGLTTCSACHTVKEVIYHVKETGRTHFSHTIHLKGAECLDCHPALYAAKRNNRRIGMSAMEQGKSCGACHNSKKAFSVKECSKCHPSAELLFKEKTTGDVLFSHKFHTGLYSCADCHVSIFKTDRSKVKVSMQKMEEGKSCGACHDGKTAFSVKDTCEACHKM